MVVEDEKKLVVDIARKTKLNLNTDAIEDVKPIGDTNEQGLQTLLVVFKDEKMKCKMIELYLKYIRIKL